MCEERVLSFGDEVASKWMTITDQVEGLFLRAGGKRQYPGGKT